MPSFLPDSSMVAEVVPSPNYGERRGVTAADMVVLHYTGMEDSREALARLCTAGTDVSAHYVVFENGRIVQCVPESRRAWHAGAAFWAGEKDINSCSIGIEIANRGRDHGYPDYPSRQVAAVIALCRGIILRLQIPPHRVLAHSDVAPSRKSDPGEKFPWQSLAQSGVGLWVSPPTPRHREIIKLGSHGDGVIALQDALASYGYEVPRHGHFDTQTMQVVTAFQRHFRQTRVDGVADPETIATLLALLNARAREDDLA